MDSPPTNHSREAIAAWTVFGLLVVAGFWFVSIYAFTMPYGDEWVLLPAMVGRQPVNPSWLWSLHNEHRLPLPRLIYMGLGALTSFDFCAGPFFDFAVLSGLSLAMMLTSRALRGRTSVYDAFFPLLLLHWGQCENLLLGFQIQFIVSVGLAGAVLLIIVHCGPQLGLWSALWATVCLALLSMCGLNGLAYLPALACWLAYAGRCRWRDPTPHARRDGLLMLGFAGALLVLVGVYFIGFNQATPKSPGIWPSLRTAWQFLCGGIGPGAKESWPIPGLLVAAAGGYALWQLYHVFRQQPQERVRAAGLFCFLGGVGTLALAIGVGRAFEGPKAGFLGRYMTLGAPLLCLFYLQFILYSSAAVKVHLQRTFALLMCGLLLVNMPKGLRYAGEYERLMTPLAADMRAGISSADLALRHGEDLGFAPKEVFAWNLEMLRNARLGPHSNSPQPADAAPTVQRMSPLLPSRQATHRSTILPGQSFTQIFEVPNGAFLSWIDVQISRCRGRRTLDHLIWDLYHVVPNQPRRLLTHGSINMRPVDRNDYVRLAIPTDCRAESGRFALVFSAPQEAPADYGVELPLYLCAGSTEKVVDTDSSSLPTEVALSLKGFLFLKRSP